MIAGLRGRAGRGWAVWSAGLVVVCAAGAATAHGLYVVALGSGNPTGIAWLYPVITDGLALVAYAASTRLTGAARRYAWAVVVLAAGLSGLAQATYLAGALPPGAGSAAPGGVWAGPGAGVGGVAVAAPVLRFGVGAWPAVAAAIAAHLLFLIGAHCAPAVAPAAVASSDVPGPGVPVGVPAGVSHAVPAVVSHAVPAVPSGAVPPVAPIGVGAVPADGRDPASASPSGSLVGVSQAERALAVARELAARSGVPPTVRELAEAAEVGRGTANRALGALRAATNGHHHHPHPDGAADRDLTPNTDQDPDQP